MAAAERNPFKGVKNGKKRTLTIFEDNQNISVLNFASITNPGGCGLGFNLQKERIGRGSTLYPNLIAKENRECFCVPIKEISLVFANCKGGAIQFVAKAFFSLFLPLVSLFTSPFLR